MRHKTVRVKHSIGEPVLGRVLREWMTNIDRLTRAWRDERDFPWFYTERALLGVVAASVWTLGGTAFEEYGMYKKAPTNKAAKSKWRLGREDIHFSIGRLGFKAEAKHVWAPATRLTSASASRLHDKLQLAVHDVRQCTPDGQQRLGILFATPMVSKKYRHDLGGRIDEWVERVFEHVSCDAKAAIFPSSVRDYCWWRGSDSAYPGVAIFIKNA